MPTGYEVRLYHDINSIAESLERIANSLGRLADYSTGAGGVSGEIMVLRKDLVDAISDIDLTCTHE